MKVAVATKDSYSQSFVNSDIHNTLTWGHEVVRWSTGESTRWSKLASRCIAAQADRACYLSWQFSD